MEGPVSMNGQLYNKHTIKLEVYQYVHSISAIKVNVIHAFKELCKLMFPEII